ncbi:MAG: hypothetical protein FWE68_06120 [Defluviitaleaceae bacterium]|nr:hypothetical protein [Defluviitaleaceae bacterium]
MAKNPDPNDPAANAPDPKGKKNKKDQNKKGGKLKKVILAVLFLAIIGLLVGVIGFNFMNLRERFLRGAIDNIPIVNTLLPAPESEEGGGPPQATNAELVTQADDLQREVDRLTSEREDLIRRMGIYTAEIENLRAITEQIEQFRRDKDEFDRMIALRDPAAFRNFYESILPENADILYREAVTASERAQELRRLTTTVASMDERSAARMLENLITTDMDIVVMLLSNVSTDAAASIIDGMSSENAAAVVKQMAPEPE